MCQDGSRADHSSDSKQLPLPLFAWGYVAICSKKLVPEFQAFLLDTFSSNPTKHNIFIIISESVFYNINKDITSKVNEDTYN